MIQAVLPRNAWRPWGPIEPRGNRPRFERRRGEVNNHIHTIYSFSPYTPSMAALRAWEAGLEAAGSVDHDSAEAAEEMDSRLRGIGNWWLFGF